MLDAIKLTEEQAEYVRERWEFLGGWGGATFGQFVGLDGRGTPRIQWEIMTKEEANRIADLLEEIRAERKKRRTTELTEVRDETSTN